MPHFLVPLLRTPGGRHALRIRRTARLFVTHVETAFDSRGRRRGLLGRSGVDVGHALVIAPCSSIHTAFMRFPIDAVFVTRDGTVSRVFADVAPWRVRASPGAFAVIELAAGAAGREQLLRGDVVEVISLESSGAP